MSSSDDMRVQEILENLKNTNQGFNSLRDNELFLLMDHPPLGYRSGDALYEWSEKIATILMARGYSFEGDDL